MSHLGLDELSRFESINIQNDWEKNSAQNTNDILYFNK